MLSSMRKSAGSWMIKILLGLIVLAFVFMGAGTFYSRRDNEVASVNGRTIGIDEYERTHRNMVQNLEQRFGDRLDQEMLEMLDIKKQAINSLVEKHLLLQTAEENHLTMPDDMLAEWITGVSAFQNNGNFDPQLYRRVLSQNRLTPESFEAMQKEAILARMTRNFVANTVPVSQAEARAWYDWQNIEVSIHYSVFSADDPGGVKVSEEETRRFFEDNSGKYRTEPQTKARYIRFDPRDHLEKVKISSSEINDYYESNRSEFTDPETVEARHILLRVDRDADEDAARQIKEKARDIRQKAESGRDFAELARQFSEDQTAEEGGYLGVLERDDTVEEFSEQAFSLEEGEISRPVRTRFGWHLIKVEDKTEESVKPLDEVEEKIKRKLALQKAKDLAYEEAYSVYNISFDGDDLVKNARDMELEIETTDFFTAEKGPENLNKAEDFAEAAFSLPEGEITEVKEIGDSYYIIQPVEKKESEIPDFEAVKEEVKNDALEEKRKNTAMQAAQTLLEQADTEEDFIQAARAAGREVKTTGFFTRNQPVDKIGQNRALSQAAFFLSQENPIAESAVAGSEGKFYAIALKDRKTPDDSEFEEEKQQVISQLTEQKQRNAVTKWISYLRETGDIEISDRIADLSE